MLTRALVSDVSEEGLGSLSCRALSQPKKNKRFSAQTCLALDREATPEVAQRTLEEKDEEDVM